MARSELVARARLGHNYDLCIWLALHDLSLCWPPVSVGLVLGITRLGSERDTCCGHPIGRRLSDRHGWPADYTAEQIPKESVARACDTLGQVIAMLWRDILLDQKIAIARHKSALLKSSDGQINSSLGRVDDGAMISLSKLSSESLAAMLEVWIGRWGRAYLGGKNGKLTPC